MIDPSFTSMAVLVVDENRFMRTLLKGILVAFGIRNIREAVDGADAFKEMKVFAPDLITLELAMSPLDGFDFAQLVRRGHDSPDRMVPMIAVTAYTERHMVERARDCGIDEFLAKPITAQALYSRLHAVVHSRRPFIQSHDYFGPDRRRARSRPHKGAERRKDQVPFLKAV